MEKAILYQTDSSPSKSAEDLPMQCINWVLTHQEDVFKSSHQMFGMVDGEPEPHLKAHPQVEWVCSREGNFRWYYSYISSLRDSMNYIDSEGLEFVQLPPGVSCGRIPDYDCPTMNKPDPEEPILHLHRIDLVSRVGEEKLDMVSWNKERPEWWNVYHSTYGTGNDQETG